MISHGDFSKHHHRLLHLLQSCSTIQTLNTTKPLHALSITMGSIPNQPIFLNNNIISQYASLGELSLARKLFDKMPQRNTVSFNTIISAYSRCGDVVEAWNVFSEMRGCGFRPTQFTLGGLLSCAELDFFLGVQLQPLIVKIGLLRVDAFVGTALLGLYGRHGCLDEAVRTFEDMPCKSLVTWNSMLSLFGRQGFVEDSILLFRELVRLKVALSECSLMGVLSGFVCKEDLELGDQIHTLVVKLGFDYEVSVVNSLINMYVKCAGLCSAENMFRELPVRDVVSWNTIIGALAKSERPGKALEFFMKMSMEGLLPNQTTFVSAINSCTSLQIPMYGEFIHAKVKKNGFESDVFVGSALVDFYAKCDKLKDAHDCFDEIYEKNAVSWNALILGYANRCSSICFYLLKKMLQFGYRPNEFSFSAVLKSSLVVELWQLHCLTIRMGYQNTEYVLSSLINSYAKNGLIGDAVDFVTSNKSLPAVPTNVIGGVYNRIAQYHETLNLLSQLEEPDVVSWNIVIAACARSCNYEEVFELFKHMHMARIPSDNYTFVSLLSVCTKLCNLDLGSSIHCLIIKTDFNRCDIFVCNVLLDMYGKCGSVRNSVEIFEEMTDRNLITWTALISALGLNGYAHQALERFREMVLLGFKPDGVALNAVLTACKHGRLVGESVELFGQMKKNYGIEPEMDHYHCVVDLLARNGHTKEAEKIISSMPFPPNALIWRSFLEGCRRQRDAEDEAVGNLNLDRVH